MDKETVQKEKNFKHLNLLQEEEWKLQTYWNLQDYDMTGTPVLMMIGILTSHV